MPTHAAPQYSVLVLPPDGTLGLGTVKVPETLVTPDVTIAAPAQLEDSTAAVPLISALATLPGAGMNLFVERIAFLARIASLASCLRAAIGLAKAALASKRTFAAERRNFILNDYG
jgi:hypothetical protein